MTDTSRHADDINVFRGIPGTVRRVLVTGSRNWADEKRVAGELNELLTGLLSNDPSGELTVVHGGCPTGADSHAHHWCRTSEQRGWSIREELVPAIWNRPCGPGCDHHPQQARNGTYYPAHGPVRNQQMVDRGADLCLGFLLPGSRGTRDCLRRAEAAGIPVRVVEADG